MMCFGLLFSKNIAFKKWLYRKLENMKLISPVSFKDLVNFSDSSSLECFKCLDREAINEDTSALHINGCIFFEKTEIKQKWEGILHNFH